EEALLADEDEWPFRRGAPRDRRLALGDLVHRAAEVHGARAQAIRGAPRDRTVDRVVDLEHAGAVPIGAKLITVTAVETRAGDAVELQRRHVEEDRLRHGQLADVADALARDDRSTERPQARSERVGDPLRAAPWDRPVRDVRGHREHQREGAGERRVQRQGRMRRESREQRACARRAEETREHARREDPWDAEPREQERMPRYPEEWTERVGGELV